MKTLNISEVRNHLPEIIEGVVQSNEAVVITRHGRPVASIQPFRAREGRKDRYPLRGTPITVADDFDEPMPELWSALAVIEERDEYTTAKRSRPRRRRTKDQS